ncbi:hypothetical protein RJT34_00358 [Clitoria ternatea]|uniref:Leucine-rich repeat-containing N-terminal plant-type domain-containing protein n=1 Tax=Clitoria ternatea TaxID=43366 RepID=A0AAN9KIC1_CLITE
MCSSHKLVRCNKKDRTTLLTFKQGVTDNFNCLSSWSTQHDCCAWEGVHCHNITGRVTKLDLTPPPGLFKPLVGECNLSLLLGLEFLQFLDLSDNYFHTITTHGNFTASSLHYLETSQYDTTHIDNLQWLSRLSSIKYLDLSSIDLHKETNWLQLVAMLPSLSELHLRSCELNNILPSLNYVNLTSLKTLDLAGNNFHNEFPKWLLNLSDISYIDLSYNQLKGSIPKGDLVTDNGIYIDYKIDVFTKGHDYEINFDLLHRTIDLSVNNLSREIPSSLYGLILVQTLNLSYNHFSRTIHKEIGGMKTLESLDLSNNKLTGEIPTSMAYMSFIDYLNLSCNNLSGRIPIGTQLQIFDASSYIGNPELCGAPLRNCAAKEENGKHIDMDARNEEKRESFYVGMGFGFAVAFWGTCGSLLLVRRWRDTYYRLLDQLWDQLYVTFMVTFNHFFSKLEEAADYAGLVFVRPLGKNKNWMQIPIFKVMAEVETLITFVSIYRGRGGGALARITTNRPRKQKDKSGDLVSLKCANG